MTNLVNVRVGGEFSTEKFKHMSIDCTFANLDDRTQFEKDEDAADAAICAAVQAVVAEHKPEHFVLTLGSLFAQGLMKLSEEERDLVSEHFTWRLQTYCDIDVRKLEEE